MQERSNVLFASVVKKGLIMSDRKGVEAAKCMLMRAGLPIQVIDRVLLQDRAFNKFIRKSDLT